MTHQGSCSFLYNPTLQFPDNSQSVCSHWCMITGCHGDILWCPALSPVAHTLASAVTVLQTLQQCQVSSRGHTGVIRRVQLLEIRICWFVTEEKLLFLPYNPLDIYMWANDLPPHKQHWFHTHRSQGKGPYTGQRDTPEIHENYFYNPCFLVAAVEY